VANVSYFQKITQGGVRRVPDVGYNQFKSKFKGNSICE
jgi:hypothetical protein